MLFRSLIAVVVADRRRIVRLIRRFLPAYQASGLITEPELQMLCSLRERHAARTWARRVGGRGAARAMTDYQLAATELALVHQRAELGLAGADQFEARRQALARVMASARYVVSRYYPGASRPRV